MMAGMDTAEYIWMDGEQVPWADANVHVLTHGLHYGTGVFEGIRAYEAAGGTALNDHLYMALELLEERRGTPGGDPLSDGADVTSVLSSATTRRRPCCRPGC